MTLCRIIFAIVVSIFFRISVIDADIITSIEQELQFDENQKLSDYLLVYPETQNPKCVDKIVRNQKRDEADAYFKHGRVRGEALRRIFPAYRENEIISEEEDDDRCLAACLEKGTDATVAGYTAPKFHYDSYSSREGIETWFRQSCKMVEVCFVNHVSQTEPLTIYWIDANGGKWKQLDLEYGESGMECFDSYLGHEFLAILEANDVGNKEMDNNEQVRRPRFEERITIEHTTTKAFGEISPLSNDRTLDGGVKKTLDNELAKHFIQHLPSSSFGGASDMLPDYVIANMGAFYYNNRENIIKREWSGLGTFLNYWEANVKVVSIPWKFRGRWVNQLESHSAAINSANNENNDSNNTDDEERLDREMRPPTKHPRKRRRKRIHYNYAPTYQATLM